MNKFAPIKVAAFKCMNKCLCGCNVRCNGNAMNVAKAEKGGIIRIGILVHGVTEEKQKVNFVASDSGSNLLASTVASAEKT